MLSRLDKTIKIERGGFLYTSLMVLVVLCVPVLGGDNKIIDGIYQLICILFAFPLILSIGAGSLLKGKKTSRVCVFLGQISFPLYITHYPLIYMHTSWAQRHLGAPICTHIMVGICTFLMALGLAWAAFKLYDEPVRSWLTKHWLKR
ncbi:acyltransferase family protein [Bacteroides faecichinchillae]|uniref:acyltransferase family protein n=1 Tax=Bacteroides faecichinchillae TaxID=871325 RepID=UPI00277D0A06|nr:acyltransferase family protein [Bacteroides faecichinchillae]